MREAVRNEQFFERPVSTIMTRNVISGQPHDDLNACATTMTSKRFRHLPVLDGGKVIGVISLGDIVKAQRDEYLGEIDTLQTQLIGESPASVSSAAAALAEQVFGDLRGREIVVIGAGKVGELAIRNLVSRGAAIAIVANRTAQRAQELDITSKIRSFAGRRQRVTDRKGRSFHLFALCPSQLVYSRSRTNPATCHAEGNEDHKDL